MTPPQKEHQFNDLLLSIDEALKGNVLKIPFTNLPRLNNAINGIKKKTAVLIGGNSGTGKTAFADQIYVLDIYDWIVKEGVHKGITAHWIYNSMERSKNYKLAKWLCYKIATDEGILLDVDDLLFTEKSDKVKKYYDLIVSYKDYFSELLQYVDIVDGANNPTGICKRVDDYAMKNGTKEEISQYEKVYIPNKPKEFVFVISDHLGKLKTESTGGIRLNKKETIDKHSQYCNDWRDFYGYNPINISQFNRSLGDTTRRIKTNLAPIIEDFKDSSNTQEDADLIFALFNPFRYEVMDYLKYNISKFNSTTGHNRFRGLSLLKNTYGIDDVDIGLNFIGEIGQFKELPKSIDMTEDDYNKAVNLNYITE